MDHGVGSVDPFSSKLDQQNRPHDPRRVDITFAPQFVAGVDGCGASFVNVATLIHESTGAILLPTLNKKRNR